MNSSHDVRSGPRPYPSDFAEEDTATSLSGFKICMVVHQDYYRDGRVRRYTESLSAAGAQIDVLALRGPDKQEDDKLMPGIQVFTIPLRRSYSGRGSYLVEYSQALVLFSLWLLGLFMRKRHHVIHVHNMPDFLIFAALIPRLLGAKLILDIHDPMPEFYMSKFGARKAGRMVEIMRLQERLSVKLAHAVVTANENFKLNLIMRGIPAKKISVVNNIADGKIFNRQQHPPKRHQPGAPFVMLYPGSIAPRYGLDIPIRAMPILIAQIPNIRLRLVGPKVEYTEELITLAKTLDVSDFVDFRSAVPINEVPRLMSQADLGIYPALPDAHMDIATPSKVLEFAAMGLPIIASRLSVLETLFDDDAVYFYQAGSVEEFAQGVVQLYTDEQKRHAQVEIMDARYVQNRSWQHERNVYFRLLSDLNG